LKGRVEKEQRTKIKEEIEIIKEPVKATRESLKERQEIKIESIARNHATQPGAGVNIVLDADGTIIATKIAKKIEIKIEMEIEKIPEQTTKAKPYQNFPKPL